MPYIGEKIAQGTAKVGTVDSWLLWNLLESVKKSDGTEQRVHITDISNASRTMLCNIHTKNWDDDILSIFKIPRNVLPTICSNSQIYGYIRDGPLQGIPISGCMGDQQASLLGQLCIEPDSAKSTYGTGCFILKNTGTKAIQSRNGLLTTIAFQLGIEEPVYYALEGSISTAGAAVTWLQDSLRIISTPEELTQLASSVDTTGGVYFVPALSGLLSPYWCSTARGTIIGITQYTTRSHICRSLIEAIAFQIYDILQVMELDSNTKTSSLKVDGGLTRSQLLCQFQSDILNIPVYRPNMDERTALGAAFAAGLANGIEMWDNLHELVHVTTSNMYKYVYYISSVHTAEGVYLTPQQTAVPPPVSTTVPVSPTLYVPTNQSRTCLSSPTSIVRMHKSLSNTIFQNLHKDEITNEKYDAQCNATHTQKAGEIANDVQKYTIDDVEDKESVSSQSTLIDDQTTRHELQCLLEEKEEFFLFSPNSSFDRERSLRGWKRALQRSLHWEESS
uniref:glycerol kinase n=1 Tax=Lygus hesperus TaxID=30085 RepID=A0A0A9X2T1_LYGHE